MISSLQSDPKYATMIHAKQELKHKLHDLLKQEVTYWKQKSRVQRLLKKDLNTSFFHTSTYFRRKHNQILSLKLDNGQWIHEWPLISTRFEEFFSNLYSTTAPLLPADLLGLITPQLSDLDNEEFSCILTAGEVKTAMFSVGSRKAPGPDGFFALFQDLLVFGW